MNDKLKELTDKVYQEGIEKAKSDSETLLAEARKEADKILDTARNESLAIKKMAEQEANEFRKNVKAELSLSSKQILDKLRQDIQALLQKKVIESGVNETLNSKGDLAEIITKISSNVKGVGSGVKIHLSSADEKEISDKIKTRLASEFNEGLEIYPDENINLGFKIGPSDGNYLISFTDEDFNNILGSFLRKETISFLEKPADE